MLTNLENQLREQNASDRIDEVLEEIPRVREDLGFIPLVTPTSQIVGTQAVLNVLTGERYRSVTRETEGVLRGEYGATPAPLDAALQRRVLGDDAPITCRPADLLEPEIDRLTAELKSLARERTLELSDATIDDVLTYALFPQVGLRFLAHRDDPAEFEPAPEAPASPPTGAEPPERAAERYDVRVDGRLFRVEVGASGALSAEPAEADPESRPAAPSAVAGDAGEALPAPLSGTVFKVLVAPGDRVRAGQSVLVLEAMKMETDVSAPRDGTVAAVRVAAGDPVSVGDTLLELS
jgi:oxaloacetate decarboxylase (Na+ extruding) subunit alpha